jgi:hypothetical protein
LIWLLKDSSENQIYLYLISFLTNNSIDFFWCERCSNIFWQNVWSIFKLETLVFEARVWLYFKKTLFNLNTKYLNVGSWLA